MTERTPVLNPNRPRQLPSQTSFEELVSPHLASVRRFVSFRVPNWHDAEDVFQQTLVLAFRHMGQFRFESSLRTWLCSIALNVIRGRLRSPETQRTVAMEAQAMESMALRDQQPSVLAMLERQEMSQRLRVAIAELPETYRVVVELRDFHGLSIRETADSLFLSTPAVKSRHHRARSLLSGLMRKPGGGLSRRETHAS